MTLQYSRDILGVFLKQTFVKYPSNILETLLRDYWNLPKDQHLLLSNHTLLIQNNFSIENFKKIFSLKIFPKCSLYVPNIATLREHTANIPGILRAGCVRNQEISGKCLTLQNDSLVPSPPIKMKILPILVKKS